MCLTFFSLVRHVSHLFQFPAQTLGGTILSKTVKEKDLGVSMNANMKVSEQCRIAASEGNAEI